MAPPTDDIVAQLKEKFPPRKNKVSRANRDRIERLKNLVEIFFLNIDVGEVNGKAKISSNNPLLDLQASIQNDFQAVPVQWQDIVLAASRAKKSTGGGLCQLTTWHLKAEVVNSPGNKCTKMLVLWANRWRKEILTPI